MGPSHLTGDDGDNGDNGAIVTVMMMTARQQQSVL